MSDDTTPQKGHVKYINIDWCRDNEGYQFMRSWDVAPCNCDAPWRHYP